MDYKAEVVSKTQLTHKMFKLVVKLIEPSEMVFKAGQCVAFHVNPKNKRLYSIASVPSQKSVLDFLIDISPGGLGSQMVDAMQPGNQFELSGPFGIFTVPETDKGLLFIGTGSGLAPYISMVPALSEQGVLNNTELWWGVRSEQDIFSKEDLDSFVQQNKNFKYNLTLSQPSESWQGVRGRITTHLTEMPSEYFQNKIAYICGSTPMIKEVRTLLISKGIEPKNIKIEIFG
jgi:NAD(P)H-flavin reductase